MNASGFSRRDFLGAGLATMAVPWMRGPLLFANPPKKEVARDDRLFLFLDWFHVQKGEMKVSLDPERISVVGSPVFKYGPYLSKMPKNPINGLDTMLIIGDGAMIPAPDGSTGFTYKPETQEIRPNVIGNDTSGTPYESY